MMFLGPFRVFRPRHPLARIVAAILGVIAVLMLVALGMFALAALAIGGALFALVNAFRHGPRPRAAAAPAPPAAPGIIEGEFSVVGDGREAARDRAPH